ncbi:MAG: hypothetical protein G01um101418_765 [Parcubacteria group bacterium Gr01-1014_18]|nr:MAG: hypothetical protein G01um101418_765 [Parcubacteria group bacterium Gr01-1014_18]TSC99344.1 MAG: hypothetical protein Greene101420_272 [Parcubacteria group bacterium Greene1014_20]TSD06819.1 MAG: hypothetical protein Greene07142_553 [Parcubacteria group bacterium Greene0714_2]
MKVVSIAILIKILTATIVVPLILIASVVGIKKIYRAYVWSTAPVAMDRRSLSDFLNDVVATTTKKVDIKKFAKLAGSQIRKEYKSFRTE